ncbi:GPI-GlcNAc transferase complex, PIG-H component [Medicago truncatula]|uniref:GPI-GlcNAc transferase complex, PIG-H component n=1 Tax=Medicago truncatula TaxID=3880 RepID=G7KWM7_MEDTR|nr:GPI-GlcNAc transferase complex, PIG-H component [Medicago truncatula]
MDGIKGKVIGKVTRRFVPIDRILKPVLLECVTPVTCYWTLSLIVREESEMVLVYKKALCAATDNKDETCIHAK